MIFYVSLFICWIHQRILWYCLLPVMILVNMFVIIQEENSKKNKTFFFSLQYLKKKYFSVIEQLGGKQLVMQLLSHEDPNVRYEALLAVQKLMVHNW